GYGHNPGWKRGIRIGSAKDGKVHAYIPDPSPGTAITSAAEGVAADAQGNVYGAEVGPRDVKKYVMKNAAEAGALTLFCSTGLKAVMEELIPQFERTTHHTVNVKYGVSAVFAEAIERAEEAFD